MSARGGPAREEFWRAMGRLAAGLTLIACFFGLRRGTVGLEVGFPAPWDNSTPGELNFWLGSLLLLWPGSALVGSAFERPLTRLLESAAARLRTASERERLALAFGLSVVAVCLARLGHALVLLEQPLTDEEGGARFGGQVLASGHLMVALPPLREAFADLFFFQRAGAWTSIDFPGALVPWALSELTHTGPLVFQVLAGCAPLGVMLAVSRKDGLQWGLVADLLLLVSPMAASLSMATHTHVVSRGLLALALGLLLFVEQPGRWRSAFAGACLGAAWATRPVEVTALVLPAALVLIAEAVRTPSLRAARLATLLGALPFVVAFALYDHGVTGGWSMPRTSANEVIHPYAATMHAALDLAYWPERFGNNVAYNAMMLALWFAGPVGVVLAVLGAKVSRLHAALALGVVGGLLTALLHDDRGLHLAGPIHQSESAVVLAILAAAGLKSIWERLPARGLVSAAGVGYLALGLPMFLGWHALALHHQARGLAELVAAASDVPATPAVVLVPPMGTVRHRHPEYGPLGSFVFRWPRPSPSLDEPVLFLMDSAAARAGVSAAFPQRAAFVLAPSDGWGRPVPLERAETK